MIYIELDTFMPDNCYQCPLAMNSFATLYRKCKGEYKNMACPITRKPLAFTKRPKHCPIKSMYLNNVPEHKTKLKHGKWVDIKNKDMFELLTCSCCGKEIVNTDSKHPEYCYNCGAKMR